VLNFKGSRPNWMSPASVVVGRKYYLGPLPIHVKGFENAQTGAIRTKELRPDWIEPSKIERGEVPGWTEITNQEGVSIEAMFKMDYSDFYSDKPGLREGVGS
jgi:hypothetical protein